MKKGVNLSKLDDCMMITGIVTPPAAMVAKRAGEKAPQLKAIKAIPDVLFVPTATVLALVTVKFSKRLLMGNTASWMCLIWPLPLCCIWHTTSTHLSMASSPYRCFAVAITKGKDLNNGDLKIFFKRKKNKTHFEIVIFSNQSF